MRKMLKLLIPALLLVAVVVSCLLMNVSAAENVIYVAANGTGDGSSPDSPLGNAPVTGVIKNKDGAVVFDFKNEPYADALAKMKASGEGQLNDSDRGLHKANALYRAFQALNGKDGTIVLVGEVSIDVAERMEMANSPSEFIMPVTNNRVTITSTYGGVNYASTKGAMFVLDRSAWNSVNLQLGCETVWTNVTMQHRYEAGVSSSSGWAGNGMIFCSGFDTAFGDGITSKSFRPSTSGSGSFMFIFAGKRYSNVNTDSDGQQILINSGLWQGAFASGHGMNANNPGHVNGDVTITLKKASAGTTTNVVTLGGGGSTLRTAAGVKGNVTLIVESGARVQNNIYALTGAGVSGEVVVKVAKDADIRDTFKTLQYTDNDTKSLIPTAAGLFYDSAKLPNEKIIGSDKFTHVNPTVIYVSSNGKGAGITPQNPIGNAHVTGTATDGASPATTLFTFINEPYADALAAVKAKNASRTSFISEFMTKANALYRAFEALNGRDGTVVVVGETLVDVADRMENGSPAEYRLPVTNNTVKVTSVYGGVDYAKTNGAMFVLDRSFRNSINLQLGCKTVWENITMQHRFESSVGGNWAGNGMIFCNGFDTTFGDGITTKALKPSTNGSGSYMFIFAGTRYGSNTTDADGQQIVVNSGLWHGLYAAGHGMSTSGQGAVTGNVEIDVKKNTSGSATNIVTLGIGGFEKRNTAYVDGNVTVNIAAGARIQNDLYAVSGGGVTGDVKIIIEKGANFTGKVTHTKYNTGSTVAVKTPKSTYISYYEGSVPFNGSDESKFTTVDVERAPRLVYISANGTGDGFSPENPLGNDAGYTGKTGDQTKSALTKAFNILQMGGTVVIVDDFSIDTAEARVETPEKGPAEYNVPKAGGEVTITSVYNGVDYRASGAELILDHSKSAVTFLTFKSAVKFENININHIYNRNRMSSWNNPVTIAANGNKLTIGENVNVYAWDAAKNLEGNWYPAILGGHRYSEVASTDVTVKSGNWSAVYAGCHGMGTNYPGNVTGNATLNIEGGMIESVYGTTSDMYASGSIGGTLTINVTGGYVGALFATSSNGASNEIVVNIASTADRVAKAWGGTSDSNVPANATITYDRTVTRDDEVKYWSVVNASGDADKQPEPVYYTIYVSDVEKGRGDGSAPEHAIGHGEGYAQLRAQALAIIAANGGTNSNLSKENSAIVGSVYKQNALYRALTYNNSRLLTQGGKLVVCGTLTVDATDAMRKSLADFWCDGSTRAAANKMGHVEITSRADGVDYRQKGATLVLDNSQLGLCLNLASPTTFDHITIVHKYNSKNGKSVDNGAIIAARGADLTIGYDVQVIAYDVNPDEDARVEMYPSLCGGHRYSNSKTDTRVTVGAGQWAMLVGGNWGNAHDGNATLAIDGSAKIGTVCGTIKATNSNAKYIFNGSVWIGLWGGEVDNVYVVGKPGMIWGDASIGLGGTKINGKVRATHPDYTGDEIQSWVFNYTDKQIDKNKVVGFEEPVPATGSALPYLMVVASVALVSAAAIIVCKKKAVKD